MESRLTGHVIYMPWGEGHRGFVPESHASCEALFPQLGGAHPPQVTYMPPLSGERARGHIVSHLKGLCVCETAKVGGKGLPALPLFLNATVLTAGTDTLGCAVTGAGRVFLEYGGEVGQGSWPKVHGMPGHRLPPCIKAERGPTEAGNSPVNCRGPPSGTFRHPLPRVAECRPAGGG